MPDNKFVFKMPPQMYSDDENATVESQYYLNENLPEAPSHQTYESDMFANTHNKHRLIHSHLEALFGLPKQFEETSTGLKFIRLKSIEAIRSLKALEQSTEYWDAFLVYLITSKLSPKTLRHWEQSLSRSQLPSFQKLWKFLDTRWRSLSMTSMTFD